MIECNNFSFIIPGCIYKHFKGNKYKVLMFVKHSETTETMVVYQALYGSGEIWVRPLESFAGEVDHIKYPDVTQKFRFELVEENGD